MKKSFKLLTILALSFATISMTGCSVISDIINGGGNASSKEDAGNSIPAASISLDHQVLSLEVGQRQLLTAIVTPSDATVAWSSSKTSVATVNDGFVEAVGEGTATITAKSGGKSATCKVTVVDNRPKEVAVTSVTIDKSELTIEVGESQTLIATILPENATDKTITWTSGSSNAVVENGVVTGVKAGTATITAKSTNGKSSKCSVKVVDTPVINNEKFTKEKTYIYAGSFSFMGSDPVQYDYRYTFKTDGTTLLEDKVSNTSKTGTYRISDGMLYTYNANNEAGDMFFYYDNVIMSASRLPIVLVRDGSAVSQQGTGTLGYYAIIECNVGDTLGVLTGDKESAGYYVVLRKNGTTADKASYIKNDQIASSDFDTSVPCTKIIKVTISTKAYNCLFIVK